MERTLVILKPDALQRGIVGEIITRFERVGLKIVATKMLAPNEEHFYQHYEGISKMISRRGREAFEVTLQMMQSGPVLAMVLEGIEAIEQVRKMVGPTEPKAAPPGTIRGDYAHISFTYANDKNLAVANLIHASGNKEEAEAEIAHWFAESEIFSTYETVHARFTLPKPKTA